MLTIILYAYLIYVCLGLIGALIAIVDDWARGTDLSLGDLGFLTFCGILGGAFMFIFCIRGAILSLRVRGLELGDIVLLKGRRKE